MIEILTGVVMAATVYMMGAPIWATYGIGFIVFVLAVINARLGLIEKEKL